MTVKTDLGATPAPTENEDVTRSAATSTATDENITESSPVEDQDTETLADVISKAANGEEKAEQEADPDAEAKAKAEADADPDASKDPAKKEAEADPKPKAEDEEDTGEDVVAGQKVPYDRFKKVIDQRNTLKDQIESTRAEATTYKQGHDQYTAITGYMQENDLSTSDVAEALHIASLFASNPAEAMRLLAPKMQTLQQFTGEILPADLQDEVDRGEMSEKAAQEIVRTRNENHRLQTQQARGESKRQAQEQQYQQTSSVNQMKTAADTTQAELMQSDPDYAQKAPLLRDRLAVLINQTQPKTAAEATALVKRAHKEVTDHLRGVMGKGEIKPGPSSGGAPISTAETNKEPATMAEAIELAARS